MLNYIFFIIDTIDHSAFAVVVRRRRGIEDDLFAAIFDQHDGGYELVVFAIAIRLAGDRALVDDRHACFSSRRWSRSPVTTATATGWMLRLRVEGVIHGKGERGGNKND